MSKLSRPNAAAVFATMLAATVTPPVAAVAPAHAPVVTQAPVQAERSSAPTSAATNAVTLSPMDDPKSRRAQGQRRNAIRQVRRRMEKQGYALTGRQWRNLLRRYRNFIATGVVS